MNRSYTNVENLDQPGLMATVMAPDNNAMNTLFGKLGEGILLHYTEWYTSAGML
jgi:hypothetical protein